MMNNFLEEDIDKVRGLYNYLNEFSRMYEKMPIEVHLWKEYLIIAQIFALADKVKEEFKFLYPELNTYEVFNNMDIFKKVIKDLSNIERNNEIKSRDVYKNKKISSGISKSFSSKGGGTGSFGSGSGGSR